MTDSDEQSDGTVGCPVCARHSVDDALASQGMILTGMKALVDQDDAIIEDVFSALTPYDGHTAISLCMMFVGDICMLTGTDPEEALSMLRQRLNEAHSNS